MMQPRIGLWPAPALTYFLPHYRTADARLTILVHNGAVENRTQTEDAIKKAEQHEALKQTFFACWTIPKFNKKLSHC
jgi:hypothetical protein